MSTKSPIVKSMGPDDCGYAYRRTTRGIEVGLVTRHRADGMPRLLLDLSVICRRSSMSRLGFLRRLRVDFCICRDAPLPDNVFVLIGRDSWRDFESKYQPPGSDDWRELPRSGDWSFSWKNAVGSGYEWWVNLGWPAASVVPGTKVPIPIIGALGLAVFNGRGCFINDRWIAQKKQGQIEIDDVDHTTTFFPAKLPVIPLGHSQNET